MRRGEGIFASDFVLFTFNSRWIDVFSSAGVGDDSWYFEALFRLLLVVMSDSTSLEDDEDTMGKLVIMGALAGAKVSKPNKKHIGTFFFYLELIAGIHVSFGLAQSCSRVCAEGAQL